MTAWWPLLVVVAVGGTCFTIWEIVGPVTKLTISVGFTIGFAFLMYCVFAGSGHLVPADSSLGILVRVFWQERILTLPHDTRGYMIPVILAAPELIGGFIGLLVGGGR